MMNADPDLCAIGFSRSSFHLPSVSAMHSKDEPLPGTSTTGTLVSTFGLLRCPIEIRLTKRVKAIAACQARLEHVDGVYRLAAYAPRARGLVPKAKIDVAARGGASPVAVSHFGHSC